MSKQGPKANFHQDITSSVDRMETVGKNNQKWTGITTNVIWSDQV